jgi:hypothetical protein
MERTATLTSLTHRVMALLVSVWMVVLGTTDAHAQSGRRLSDLNIVPTITDIVLEDGQLLASGTITATVRGREITSEFSDIPVDISIAEDQTGAGECPILDLELAPINLNLLGLIVETSPICLKITAYENGGLLGDLLCSVSDLLETGVPLGDILGGLNLSPLEVAQLLTGLEDLLNAALGSLVDAVVENIQHLRGRTCAILDLALGPIDLTLLGLNVHLDDCDNGPVTVEITARRGALLGNLLCGLLHGRGIDVGSTLGEIIDGVLARVSR